MGAGQKRPFHLGRAQPEFDAQNNVINIECFKSTKEMLIGQIAWQTGLVIVLIQETRCGQNMIRARIPGFDSIVRSPTPNVLLQTLSKKDQTVNEQQSRNATTTSNSSVSTWKTWQSRVSINPSHPFPRQVRIYVRKTDSCNDGHLKLP